MDWKTISNNLLLVGLFVAMVTMFNQVNGRLDAMQAETNRRFDTLQTEMNRRFDANQRQHDEIKDVLRVFEGRSRASKKKPASAPRAPTSRFFVLASGSDPLRLDDVGTRDCDIRVG